MKYLKSCLLESWPQKARLFNRQRSNLNRSLAYMPDTDSRDTAGGFPVELCPGRLLFLDTYRIKLAGLSKNGIK